MIALKKYIITLSLMVIGLLGVSQSRLPSLTVADIEKSTAFDELVELLSDSDYFIQNMEKDVGFIQVKTVIKKRGIFAKRAGNKIIYNIFVKQAEERVAQISLQANLEISDRTEDGYYYRDEGVSDDPKIYEKVLALIESHFENQ